MGSSLRVRIASVLVLAPLALLVMWVGGWWFVGTVSLVMGVATWEYVRLLSHLGHRPSYPFAVGLVCVLLLDVVLPGVGMLQPAIGLLLLASLAWHLIADRSDTRIQNWLLPLGGALYVGWLGQHMVRLRWLDDGFYALLATLLVTWTSDVTAFLVGSAWGKHPIAPRTSPKKTWEGYGGQVVGGTAVGALLFALRGLGWWHGAMFGLLIAALAPLGDLGVSMMKRQVGVKDSSRLIPGHGGLLDRLDSVLVAVLLGYLYFTWVLGIAPAP